MQLNNNMQTQKKVETPAEKKFEELKAEFEATKAKEIQPTKTKIINLRLVTSCGCGGGSTDTESIHIEVPEDYNEFSELELIGTSDAAAIYKSGIELLAGHFFGDPKDDIDREVW